MDEPIKCEHCGGVCADDEELQVMHRSCRFKAAFPGCYSVTGPLVKFDVDEMKTLLKKQA